MEEKVFDLSIETVTESSPCNWWVSYHHFLKNEDFYTEVSIYGDKNDTPLECEIWQYSKDEFENRVYSLLFYVLKLLVPEMEPTTSLLNVDVPLHPAKADTAYVGRVHGDFIETPNILDFLQVTCLENTTIFSELPELGEVIKKFTTQEHLNIKLDLVKETFSLTPA